MSVETDIVLPQVVQKAYEVGEYDPITRLAGGLVNDTLLVSQGEHKFILRRLAPILGSATIRNTCIISHHLNNAGWEAPTITPTIDGNPHVSDETGRLWHAMSYIESDAGQLPPPDETLALHAGQLLGSWHETVKSLDYQPESLPHFHDTDYIAKKLELDIPLLADRQSRELAILFLTDYRGQPEREHKKAIQVIHGDPKLDNMLYRNGEPFTLIDFDCTMYDSVLTDVGDFLRSLGGKLVLTGQEITDSVTSFVKGYQAGSESSASVDRATYEVLQATRRIACELGMRYLSDIVDGQNYFSWDQKSYVSRDEALHDKALLQYRVLQAVNENLKRGMY